MTTNLCESPLLVKYFNSKIGQKNVLTKDLQRNVEHDEGSITDGK